MVLRQRAVPIEVVNCFDTHNTEFNPSANLQLPFLERIQILRIMDYLQYVIKL